MPKTKTANAKTSRVVAIAKKIVKHVRTEKKKPKGKVCEFC